mgnify:CR=1 FL=1
MRCSEGWTLSKGAVWSRNWKAAMSTATLPASAMICIEGGAAMKPRSHSAKSLSSAKGRLARAASSTRRVWAEGALPRGWKCPASGCGASCGCAAPSPPRGA